MCVTDIIEILLSYTRAFEEGYFVRLVVMHIVNIVDFVMLLNTIAFSSRATVLYIKVYNVMITHEGVVLCL